MNSAVQLLTILGGFTSLIVLVGGLYFISRGSFSKARIETLKDELDDSRKAATELRARVLDLEHKEDIHVTQIKNLDEKNRLLTDMITQRAQVDKAINLAEDIERQVKEHHEQAMEKWDEFTAGLSSMAAAIAKQGRTTQGQR